MFNDNCHPGGALNKAGSWIKDQWDDFANRYSNYSMDDFKTDMAVFLAVVPGGGIADEAGAGARVIGHFPEYVEMAEKTGAKYFSVPEKIWNGMSEGDRWAANQKFLDRGIANGDYFHLATPMENIRPGSYLEREVNHLSNNGYTLSEDGSKLIPGR